jgi:hypothetical protein
MSVLALLASPVTLRAAPAVTGLSGPVRHGGAVTVTGSGFGAKANSAQTIPAAPLIWDITSEQYVGGVNRDAYHGYADGHLINSLVWRSNSQNVAYSTSRPNRHARMVAHYAGWGQNGNPAKMHLYAPTAPSTQRSFYLSFYRKCKYAASGVDYSAKSLRIDNQYLELVGTTYAGQGGYSQANSAGHGTSWIDGGDQTVWTRWEFYCDLNRQWFDVWKDGHYHLGSNSGAGGTVEFRPAADWRFRTGLTGWQFDCPTVVPGHPIAPALFGYDQGGTGSSPGQEVDLSEVYYDNTQARVEVSDQAMWSDAPSARPHREVQGLLTAWSDTQIQLVLNQGGFDSLPGKYLYVIDAAGRANSAGHPLIATNHLTVNSGSGDGDYGEGEVVAIVADAAPSGQQFAGWAGDTGALADPAAASTTVTMPDTDMEVTATYSQVPPSLAGDRSGDGFVGQADLDIVLGAWGQHVAALSAPDPSGDGFVGQADLDIVLGQWGQGTHR